jgi:hypothetical protein
MSDRDEVGPELVTCKLCERLKGVRGRDMGAIAGQGKCDWDCPGYMQEPIPSDLHPGEKRSDFGY